MALALAKKVYVDESKLRIVGRQTTKSNHPYTTISKYYKRMITIPLIDHLDSLDAKFDIESVYVGSETRINWNIKFLFLHAI